MKLNYKPELQCLVCPDCSHRREIPRHLIGKPERFVLFRQVAENEHVLHRTRYRNAHVEQLNAHALRRAAHVLGSY